MKLSLPKIKLDWNHIVNDLVFLGIAGALAIVFLKSSQFVGFLSYNGLSPHQVKKTYHLFLKRYPVLSMVEGSNPLLGGHFVRGIAGEKGGILYYYHYSDDGMGKVEFNIYPEMYETWTTDPGILGVGSWFTGRAIYP